MSKIWLRRVLITSAIVMLLFTLFFSLYVPYWLRTVMTQQLAQELGRPVTLQAASANPFLLRLTLQGLAVSEPTPAQGYLLKINQVVVDLSSLSLLYRAPVLDALELEGLDAHIVRTAAQQFNFNDIVQRWQSRPQTTGTAQEPARFALYNIVLRNSHIRLTDRVQQRQHQVTELALSIPFISNLPAHIEVQVTPSLSARVNGTHFNVYGQTQPFHDSKQSVLDLKLAGLDIPTYLGFSPVRLEPLVNRGKLDTELRIAFRQAASIDATKPARQPELVISGLLALRELQLQTPLPSPQALLHLKQLQIKLAELAPLTRRLLIDDIQLNHPHAWVRVDRHGVLNWKQLMLGLDTEKKQAHAKAHLEPAQYDVRRPWQIGIKNMAISAGVIQVEDERASKFALSLSNTELHLRHLDSNQQAEPAQIEFKTSLGGNTASLDMRGSLALARQQAELEYSFDAVPLGMAQAYVAQWLEGSLEGLSQGRGKISIAKTSDSLQLGLRDVDITVEQLQLKGSKISGADTKIRRLVLQGGEFDLGQRQFMANNLLIDTPSFKLKRLSNGTMDWQDLVKKGAIEPQRRAAPLGQVPEEPDWNWHLSAVEIVNGDLDWQDESVQPRAELRLTGVGAKLRPLSSAATATQLSLKASSSGSTHGSLVLAGSMRTQPFQTDLRIDLANLDLVPLRPYLDHRLNALFIRGELTTHSRLQLTCNPEGTWRTQLEGSLRLLNLRLMNTDGEEELLRWQALDIDRLYVNGGGAGTELQLGKMTLSDFFARVIVSKEGRLNLAEIVQGSATAVTSSAAPEPLAPAAATQTLPTASRIRIDRIELTRGNLNFTDNFIRPNYTANLTDLSGSISTLASEASEPASLVLSGSVDHQAPVTIEGRLNPLAPKIFLDIKGSTQGVDLPSFTPYAAKYAGYPITKGKLAMDVSYLIENDQLKSNNRLFLDQLTFGERTESPAATKLPVLFAVALLKNTRGEIDINLPVSGSLNDPQFSVGGIVVQVMVNLLAKAVTSPFSLLAAAFGSDAELGHVDFVAGTTLPASEQLSRLDTLAKALNDRPALRLDIIGRASAESDIPGLKQAQLEARLRAAKVRRVVRSQGLAVAPESVSIEQAERAGLLAAVYAEERNIKKPRNALGIAQILAPEEMEQLLLDSMQVSTADLRALANARSVAIRNHLEQQGKVARERLFLVEPKLALDQATGAVQALTRAELILK